MTYENKYKISAILNKIALCIALDQESIPFGYRLFKRIMMDNEEIEPVITYERTLKQKYQDLVDLGYVSDSDYPRLDITRVKAKLARTTEANA